MNKRDFNIAYVNAELKAKITITKFEKEFENGNQNQRRDVPANGQTNDAPRNVPQQPGYSQ